MTQFVNLFPSKSTPDFVMPVRLDTSHMPLLNPDDVPKTILMQTLLRACSVRREDGTATEGRFVAWLCNRLPVTLIDGAGNVHVDLRTRPEHRSMFTAHTDSVHHGGGLNNIRVDGYIWRADKGHALGADDGAGVALLCHMISNGVPGYYVFFRGEECGGTGSSWLASFLPGLFNNIDRAIAFDRGGYDDVITHQARGRCCSDAFADALAIQLTTETSWYLPSDHGIFTDTANLTELVPECTNISVGYKNQHGDREEQNIPFLVALSEQVLKVLWDDLPTKRDPKQDDRESYIDAFKRSNWMVKDTPEVTPLGAHEAEAIDAITDAIEQGDFDWLFDLIADSVYPNNLNAVRHLLRSSRLNEDLLLEAMSELEQGWTADIVLESLYDACCVI